VTDYITFVNDVAALVLKELPLQSLDNAIALVYAYISDVGGWVPDDQLQPQGDGAPANGFSETQSADAITQEEFNKVYDIDFDVNIVVKVHCVAKLSPGLSLNDAATAMVNQVSDFITDTINNSPIPIECDSVGTQTPDSDRSILGGYTDEALRQTIQADLEALPSTQGVVDHKGIALLFVRETYGLDETWNVFSVYNQPDNPIVVLIKKYTDTTYATLDGDVSTFYVINISPVSYQVVAGVIID